MPRRDEIIISGHRVTGQQYQYINAGINRGLSTNEIQDVLSKSNMGLRRQNLLDITRELRGVEKVRDTFKFIPKKYGVALEKHETSKLGIDSNYAYTVKVNVFSDILNRNIDRWVRIKSDTRLPVGQILKRAEDALIDYGVFDNYKEHVEKTTIFRALKRGEEE